jgi:hypothetical protein
VLSDAPERCIEIVPTLYEVDNFPQVFDLWCVFRPGNSPSAKNIKKVMGQHTHYIVVGVFFQIPHLASARDFPDCRVSCRAEQIPFPPPRS